MIPWRSRWYSAPWRALSHPTRVGVRSELKGRAERYIKINTASAFTVRGAQYLGFFGGGAPGTRGALRLGLASQLEGEQLGLAFQLEGEQA